VPPARPSARERHRTDLPALTAAARVAAAATWPTAPLGISLPREQVPHIHIQDRSPNIAWRGSVQSRYLGAPVLYVCAQVPSFWDATGSAERYRWFDASACESRSQVRAGEIPANALQHAKTARLELAQKPPTMPITLAGEDKSKGELGWRSTKW
jgi:hypothetical protein